MLDDDGTIVFDSNAILVYLATKYDADRRWLPRDPKGQAAVQAWLSVAAGQIAFGPAAARLITVFGAKYNADDVIGRAHALLKVMDAQLATRTFLVGTDATLADIAGYSYISAAPEGNVDLSAYPQRARLAGPRGSACRASCRSRRRPSAWRPEPPPRPPRSRPWTPPTARDHNPFHAGEQAVHDRLGIRERMVDVGQRVIRTAMPEQHQRFFEQLPFMLVGSVDAPAGPGRRCWWAGPASCRRRDAKRLDFRRAPDPRRPAGRGPGTGRPAGLPRHRAAHAPAQPRQRPCRGRRCGRASASRSISRWATARSTSRAASSHGCATPPTCTPRATEALTSLDADARALIARSDTLFVATQAPAAADDPDVKTGRGADVSHRGGRPGFVKIEDEHTFLVPDFTGNFFFMTLGNLQLNPRAGVLFIDFDTGDLLTLTGTAEVVWGGDELKAFDGAERAWRFRIESGWRLREALPLRWALSRLSPHSRHHRHLGRGRGEARSAAPGADLAAVPGDAHRRREQRHPLLPPRAGRRPCRAAFPGRAAPADPPEDRRGRASCTAPTRSRRRPATRACA